ncbi:uncharacterized protein MYCFIDRAFT_28422 [Pseudocercospora fijiensis CIRAD86]|uniref:Mitochondrial outer membrane protein n=1 Tax=Pseudocercospora fijiensis (strain CIRAD86) TaxID=383855 RepID=N1QA46_PSEFD|nr:uncharacterized protein MYCFIDRAFT_28422 [Pseudocercospora fijiensis CIRAD86]EME87767.1 hypothetical protein MYCFIDRAFT_28422 [Pseudocercospora fijiensis CIRAD86]
MPNDDRPDAPNERAGNAFAPTPSSAKRSIFALPTSIKRVFDTFPLREFPANALPIRAPRHREEHVLHVFATDEGAKLSKPSFNPGCLKWQTYLLFSGVPFKLTSSSNHASPSGSLPFLQPAGTGTETNDTPQPIPSSKLKKWLASQGFEKISESSDIRYEAFASLVDTRIRKAWLCQLYLAPHNAELMHRLYVAPCSSHTLVQMAIASHLRSAAEAELVKSAASNIISTFDLLKDAEEAIEALSILLSDDDYFFGQQKPGLLDASIFAYTELILDDRFGWKYNPLLEHLSKHENLTKHRNRIRELYF